MNSDKLIDLLGIRNCIDAQIPGGMMLHELYLFVSFVGFVVLMALLLKDLGRK